MRIAFNPSTVAALTTPPNNKDITFDLRGRNIFARGVKFYGTDTNTWRDVKINNVSIGTNILDLRNGSNTTLTNTNGVVTINSTWRPVVDNLTSDSTTSSLSANQGRVLAGLINGKSDSDHNHDDRYLKLTGGIMSGQISSNYSVGTLIAGCTNAILKATADGYNSLICAPIKSGNISISAWTAEDNLNFGYAKKGKTKNSFDTRMYWDAPNNNLHAGAFTGHLYGTADNAVNSDTTDGVHLEWSGELGANDYTWLAGWTNDGKKIKAVNKNQFATSGHNHDGRYVYNYGDTANVNGQALNQNALFMSTTSGISGDWWHILQAAWDGEYRWNSQIAFPTQNRNGMYYRSGLDDNTKWGSWVKLLDVNNYSSTLDSRYYTESEVNSLLSTKLDRVNLSVGGWNPRGYNLAADYCYNGGDLSISESGGQIHVSVDGYFWQNEGQYRVLDTSDIGGIRGSVSIQQYLSNTDTNWYPLIWGGDAHRNTYTSTGAVYKSHNVLSWQTSSQTLYATKLSTTNLDTQTALFHPGNDSTLKIYSGNTQGAVSDGHIGLQTSIDNTDGQTHVYPTQYGSRCVLALQPRGGSVYIGNMPNGGNGRKLNVNGDIGLFNAGSIKDLAIGGGIYWNPNVESATDSSDVASITLVKAGVAGGTTLVLSQMNDANDTIQFKTSTAARLYHNSYPILTTQNTYVSNNKGYINGTEITQVNNADTVDGEHASNFSYTHQSSFDFNTIKNGRIVTFDQSNTNYNWINGFASTYNNYLTSVLFNTHRTSNWYVGYIEGNASTGKTNGLQAVHKLAFADQIPTSLKNPYSLTLKANGTTLAIYDGSSAKEANFTYANVGAASASHTHSYYAVNENYRGFKKAERLPTSGFYQSIESESGGNAPWKSWMHLINCQNSNTDNNYALQIAASFFDNHTFKIRVTHNSVNNAWRDIIHSGNIGSQSVNYANSAGNASTLGGTSLGGLFTAFGNNAHNITATIGGVTKQFQVNYASDADKVDGYHANTGQAPYGHIPTIRNDGVMEIGKYIDFHNDNGGKYDYSTRLQSTGDHQNTLNLPSKSGTLALTSDIKDTNTWRPITDDYELGKSDTSLSSLGSLTLYNDLLGAIPDPTDYYWANNQITTSPKINAQVRVSSLGAGCLTDIANTVMATNWLRATGNTGIYFQNHGGGLYMSDNDWIRTWANKALYVNNIIRSTNYQAMYGSTSVSAAKLEGANTLVYGADTSSNSINSYLRGTIVTLQVKKGANINYNALQLTDTYIYCNNYCDMKQGAIVSGGNFTVNNNAYFSQDGIQIKANDQKYYRQPTCIACGYAYDGPNANNNNRTQQVICNQHANITLIDGSGRYRIYFPNIQADKFNREHMSLQLTGCPHGIDSRGVSDARGSVSSYNGCLSIEVYTSDDNSLNPSSFYFALWTWKLVNTI